jgi:hypothetical protein
MRRLYSHAFYRSKAPRSKGHRFLSRPVSRHLDHR